MASVSKVMMDAIKQKDELNGKTEKAAKGELPMAESQGTSRISFDWRSGRDKRKACRLLNQRNRMN